ncbi:MAG: DUF1959 family protein [Methanoculleaceae archaeon]
MKDEELLYERDLTAMKYNIIISTRHDLAVRQVAEFFKIPVQKMRSILITRLDMSRLENLPQLIEAETDTDDPVSAALGCRRFTCYIPLIPGEEMKRIELAVRAFIHQGMDMETAVAEGREMEREVLLR